MKAFIFTLLIILFIYSKSVNLHPMMIKLKNSKKYSSTKTNTMTIIGTVLLNNKYEPSFVAGVLANILHEGSIGIFEISNYVTHPEKKPQYLVYMDSLYDYGNKYSGKYIMNVSLKGVYKLLQKLKANNWSRGKFGLGCIQWTGGRTYLLVETYLEVCNNCDKITLDQATEAEGRMVMKELKGSHSYVYNNWKNQNSNTQSSNAAYNAGYIVCKQYEVPADTENRSKQRGNTALEVYSIMTS